MGLARTRGALKQREKRVQTATEPRRVERDAHSLFRTSTTSPCACHDVRITLAHARRAPAARPTPGRSRAPDGGRNSACRREPAPGLSWQSRLFRQVKPGGDDRRIEYSWTGRRLDNNRNKRCRFLMGCATHSTSTVYRGGNLNAPIQ